MIRISLSALVITALVFAVRQWQPSDWWWVAGAAAVLVVLLGRWGGAFLTTVARRWFALLRRNRRRRRNAGHAETVTDARVTVLLEIEWRDRLPLAVIASYLDRYGIRCTGIRVTFREPDRVTWISLTVSAADNLAALLARSPQMPLHQTAQVVQRRLAGHLREQGWAARLAQTSDIEWPGIRNESWCGATVDGGHLAAYRVPAHDALPETLEYVHGYPARQAWTVLEMTGDPAHPAVTAGCALLTDEPPQRHPVDGLVACSGMHGPALAALNPSSTVMLAEQWAANQFDVGALDRLIQPVARISSSVSAATSR